MWFSTCSILSSNGVWYFVTTLITLDTYTFLFFIRSCVLFDFVLFMKNGIYFAWNQNSRGRLLTIVMYALAPFHPSSFIFIFNITIFFLFERRCQLRLRLCFTFYGIYLTFTCSPLHTPITVTYPDHCCFSHVDVCGDVQYLPTARGALCRPAWNTCLGRTGRICSSSWGCRRRSHYSIQEIAHLDWWSNINVVATLVYRNPSLLLYRKPTGAAAIQLALCCNMGDLQSDDSRDLSKPHRDETFQTSFCSGRIYKSVCCQSSLLSSLMNGPVSWGCCVYSTYRYIAGIEIDGAYQVVRSDFPKERRGVYARLYRGA